MRDTVSRLSKNFLIFISGVCFQPYWSEIETSKERINGEIQSNDTTKRLFNQSINQSVYLFTAANTKQKKELAIIVQV